MNCMSRQGLALSLINSIAREGKADSFVPIIADKALIYNIVSLLTMLYTRFFPSSKKTWAN